MDLQLPAPAATGIGHLPHYDPTEAVEFVVRHSPRLPSAPALPARSRREGMIAQAFDGVEGLVIESNGEISIDQNKLDRDSISHDATFSSDAWVGLRAFVNAMVDTDGPLKFSLTGPVTAGCSLVSLGVDPDVAFAIAGSIVRERAKQLVRYIETRVPQSTPVVIFDEPILGSLVAKDFPLGPNESIDLISGAMAPIERVAVTGVHCCTKVDYRLLFGVGASIISIPVDERITTVPGVVNDFLERGGVISWGAVPTGGPLGETVERHWRRLMGVFHTLSNEGCDPLLLRTKLLVTPVCGLAWHGVPQAEQVMIFANEIVNRLQIHSADNRFSVGA